MPDPALSAAIQEAYASAPSDVVIHHTLEIRHPSFTAPIRVVRDFSDLVATLEADAPLDPGAPVTFVAMAFDLALPEVAEAGLPEVVVALDNVTAEIEAALAGATQSLSPVEITYRPYLSSDLTAPHMDPPLHLEVRHIEATVFQVRARCGFGDLFNAAFPRELYTPARFPGLARV